MNEGSSTEAPLDTPEHSSLQRLRTEALLPPYDVFTPEQRGEWHKKFWALGNAKWKESVDGMDRVWGQNVYDECLHGKNGGKNEPGYMSSMASAQQYMSNQLGKRSTSEMWLEVHSLACTHFRGRSTGTLMGPEKVGKLRGIHDAIFQPHCMNGSLAVTQQAADEINLMSPTIINIVWPDGKDPETLELKEKETPRETRQQRNCRLVIDMQHDNDGKEESEGEKPKLKLNTTVELHFVTLTADQVRESFEQFIDDFYHQMTRLQQGREPKDTSRRWQKVEKGKRTREGKRTAQRDERKRHEGMDLECAGGNSLLCEEDASDLIKEQVLEEISKLHQRLERLHPARDGNTRTNVLLLNKHLIEFGFCPVLLRHTQKSSCVGLPAFIDLVKEGMEDWKHELSIEQERT